MATDREKGALSRLTVAEASVVDLQKKLEGLRNIERKFLTRTAERDEEKALRMKTEAKVLQYRAALLAAAADMARAKWEFEGDDPAHDTLDRLAQKHIQAWRDLTGEKI